MDISACGHAVRHVPKTLLLTGMLVLAACGEKEAPQAPAAVADTVSETRAAQRDTVTQLLSSADQAVKEGRLFLPVGESAFEQYLQVLELQADQADAHTALLDLSPYAALYIERKVIEGDLAESERVLAMMTRFDTQAPALRRLHEQIEALRARQHAEARREPALVQQTATPQQTARPPAAPQQQAAQQQTARPTARQTPPASPPLAREAQTPPPAALPVPDFEAVAPATDDNTARVAAAPIELPTPTPIRAPLPTLSLDDATSGSADRNMPAAPLPQARDQAAAVTETAALPVAAAPIPEPPTAERSDRFPNVVSSVQPRYPSLAVRRRIEGRVEVSFTVMPDGSVSNVRVLNSQPSGTFDREAVNAMERWRFAPSGRVVEGRRVFNFKLQ